jgi:hypothetical protein
VRRLEDSHDYESIQIRRAVAKTGGALTSRGGRSKNRQSVRTNYERYLALARAQTLAGDQVEAENSYQHAEHFFRSMSKSAR